MEVASEAAMPMRAWLRTGALLLTSVLVGLWIRDWTLYLAQPDRSLVAVDYTLYMDAAGRFLAGGPFYNAYQLAGPYEVTPGDVLYPPTAMPLFALFTVLPWPLWWAVPIAGIAAIVAAHRPRPEAWAIIALCLWFPATNVKLLTGNPVMWGVFAVALATRWGWAGPLALVKPSLAPFALIRVWQRDWWLGAAVMAVLALAMAPQVGDWLTALANSRNPSGLLYSVQEVPMMAIPVIAWLGRR